MPGVENRVGSQLIPIGRFSRVTRLSVKTLRFYDEVGLLRPAAVDPDSGYRYYHRDQLETAERIRLLRSLDMPLEEVGEILKEPDPTAAEALVARHKRRVAEQIARYQRTLKALGEIGLAGYGYQPALKPLPGHALLLLRVESELKNIEQARALAFGEVEAFARRAGVGLSGPRVNLTVECSRVEALVKGIADDFDVLGDARPVVNEVGWVSERLARPEEPFIRLEVPPARVAYVVHLGPYEPLHLAHQAVLNWVGRQGLQVSGESRELYHVGPADTDNPDEFRTEVQYPIQ